MTFQACRKQKKKRQHATLLSSPQRLGWLQNPTKKMLPKVKISIFNGRKVKKKIEKKESTCPRGGEGDAGGWNESWNARLHQRFSAQIFSLEPEEVRHSGHSFLTIAPRFTDFFLLSVSPHFFFPQKNSLSLENLEPLWDSFFVCVCVCCPLITFTFWPISPADFESIL